MGQAIVYCSNCSAQLRGSDFETRRAFKIDDLQFCLKCYREVVGAEPPPVIKPAVPAASRPSGGTSRITIAPPPAPPPEAHNRGTLYGVYAAVGLTGVGLLIALAASSGGGEPRSSTPTPPVAETPPTPPASPRLSAREAAAQQALAKALRTQDLATRRALLADAVAQASGTLLYEDARHELDLTERKLQALAKPEPTPAPPEPVPAPAPPPPPAKPKPKPVAAAAVPDRSRAEAARTARWEAALAPATGRDYAAAIAALEKLGDSAADLGLLKSVAELHQEALQALTRLPKGQKVALDSRDLSGAPRKSEGVYVDEENGLAELRIDGASLEIETGEILPSWLAENLRARGGAVDPGTAALFCLLEGDDAGARRLAGDKAGTIPEKYWAYARKVASAQDPGRTFYQEALALANAFPTAADAVPKYQSLLADYAGSPFVRRNKAAIAARAQQCARDFLFVSSDLKPSGTFKAVKSVKGYVCWTSDADSDPAKLKDNFLELSYSVLADTAYKCWIYAGGCCLETLDFGVQGTEYKSGKEKEPVELGSAGAAMIKPWFSSLKKTHSAHTGPKQPSHWEWIAIPLPRYSKGGLQQLRIVTAQKGFSVAFACVTATRGGAPREADLRELDKARGSPALAAPGLKAVVLWAAALDGSGRALLGEVREGALYGAPLFGASFTGTENSGLTLPVSGSCELRITYFLKTATELRSRIRVRRPDGKSDPYDAIVAHPVVGRATELRIPFSEFKPPSGAALPPLSGGDAVPMIYVLGQDPNCGLRLDAMSVVELASARTVAATPGKLVYAENFDKGPGKFTRGELVDGGVGGSKAMSIQGKGVDCFFAWSVPVKESVTVSFKLKPLGDAKRVDLLVWSEGLKDNGRYFIEGLKTGEWKEVRFKASELRIGSFREGQSIDVFDNIKIFVSGFPPETRVLLDDFEIRE